MLKLTVTLTDGAIKEFYRPIALELNKTYAAPCHQLVISVALLKTVGEVAKVALSYEGLTLFEGIADSQTVTADQNGVRLVLECRSREALLLDNEAIPGVQYYLRLSDLVRRQAAAYGVMGVRGSDPTLSQFAVYKGASVWSVLDRFCRQTLRCSPRIGSGGFLETTPPGQGRVVTVSNQKPGAWNYVSIEQEINRHKVVSEVRVNNFRGNLRYGGYFTRVVNPDALGVRRLRLLNPSSEWASLPKASAQETIRASMLKKACYNVVIPAVVRCDIGDTAVLADPPFEADGLFIGGITYTLGDEGISTILTLYDRRYI
ncbi:hypothetical protein [Acetanaerobacterium elongatum]|uniref:Mu-like prophage tail protein gpP n=1 Tax=Acetanaerobacterium elongatum TaxID=258515 RepID=A0A1H0EL14_9FIRM|nr:hypothetical protein [Acetanaerobacterium elongatum]SDN83062.1 hypothetical protein SAMN05192585_13420 [Acetanaerobacterium elongatum]